MKRRERVRRGEEREKRRVEKPSRKIEQTYKTGRQKVVIKEDEISQ